VAFENTKKLPLSYSPEISLVLCIFYGVGKSLFFDRSIENKDGVMCRGFLLDDKILYLEPKHTFKEIEMVRNKRQ